MEINFALEQLKSVIGQDSSKSPSPAGRWLNGTLLEVSEGHSKIAFVVRKEMTNPIGIMHGGVASMMMDEAMGVTMYGLNREHFFTSVNLSIDFLEAGKLGETLIAETQVVRGGGTIVNFECRLVNKDGKTVARAHSNMVRTHIQHPHRKK